MKICIIFGTRPEIIKISQIIKECQRQKIDFVLIHTNQHYAKNLDEIFFECLKLPKPKYNLNVGSGLHGETTGKMITLIEDKLLIEKPDVVLVQGDTNSVLAGALSAAKLNIPVGHIEAGLRSFDMSMPEEINRILVDHISSYLFVPTSKSKENLINEGIKKNKIFLTGNTIVDALKNHINIAKDKSKILNILNLKKEDYILSTIHRQENIISTKRLKDIFFGLEKVSLILNKKVIIPGHPRLIKTILEYKINLSNNIILIEPVDYFDFITLEKNASIIITDSGGVQEEACILKTPCITVRDNTERPETILIKSNILAGSDVDKIIKASKKMFSIERNWRNPFGGGKTSLKILKILKENINCNSN